MRSAYSRSAQRQARILLVDDNADGIAARRALLEQLGYQVTPACCGSEALTIAEGEKFDLVITDLKMTPVDGRQLISTLREHDFRNPIILLTGFADALGLRPETTGADAIVQKNSTEVSTLVRQVKRLLTPPRKTPGSYSPSPNKRDLAR